MGPVSGRIRGMKAYLDNMASTPADPDVMNRAAARLAGIFGNPHSTLHPFGREAAAVLSEARVLVAGAISARPDEIVFTPSATIADNLAVLGIARARKRRGRHIVVSAIEHPAVLMAALHLRQEEDFEVDLVMPDQGGIVRPEAVEALLRPDTTLVSVMAVNNEIGTIQPIQAIASVAKGCGAFFHTDASQAPGRISLDFVRHADLVTLSSHKVHGPRGAGALMIRRRRDINIKPLFFGGGQEGGLCSGTANVDAALAFGMALELAVTRREVDSAHVARLSAELARGVMDAFPGSVVVGDREMSIPHCLSIRLEGIPGETFVSRMARVGVAVSLGSACHGDPAAPSHVLTAIGMTAAEARRTVRFGLGRFTTAEEIAYAEQMATSLAGELLSGRQAAEARP